MYVGIYFWNIIQLDASEIVSSFYRKKRYNICFIQLNLFLVHANIKWLYKSK